MEEKKLSPEEIKRVKGLGFLQDKRYPDVFNARVITRNGRITTDEHRAIAEAADRFQPFDGFSERLRPDHRRHRGTGSPGGFRKGTTCQYGLIDTYALSGKIHERFYVGYHNMPLPHKFKIAVGGCPNNCVKPDLNDLGVVGQRVPVPDIEKCRGCKKCQIEKNCPIHAARLEDGRISIDPDACNHCGRCKGKCPFGAVEEYREGYKILIGGRWGKKTACGRPLPRLFTTEEEVMAVIDRAILLFREEGIAGERFADTVARLGFDYVSGKLLGE